MITTFKKQLEACIGDVFVMELQIKRSNGQWTLAQVHQGKKAVDRTWECGLLSSVSKRFHSFNQSAVSLFFEKKKSFPR